MAGYLRPRRGKLATATSQNIVLKRGEVFFEVPTSGVGTGAGKIKMGDGTTAYSALPYFLEPTVIEVATSTIAFAEATSTDNATLLNAIASGAQLKTIIGNVKKLLRNLDSSVTQLNNDLVNIGSMIYKGLVDIGITDSETGNVDTSVNASLCLIRISENRANIIINYHINSNIMSNQMYRFIDVYKIFNALGITDWAFNPAQTTVIFKPSIIHNGDVVNIHTAFAEPTIHGYTGIMFDVGGGIGRVYEDTGSFGCWALDTGVYLNDSYGTIIINAAEVTFA